MIWLDGVIDLRLIKEKGTVAPLSVIFKQKKTYSEKFIKEKI